MYSENTNLDDSIFSPASPWGTNLKLHNIPVTLNLVNKVITDLLLSKASGPNCIQVMILKNWEPKISYILAEFFNMSLQESYFRYCWKVSSMVFGLKNVGERAKAKTCGPASLPSVVRKTFGKLVNNRLIDHLKKCGQVLGKLWFQVFLFYCRSSESCIL